MWDLGLPEQEPPKSASDLRLKTTPNVPKLNLMPVQSQPLSCLYLKVEKGPYKQQKKSHQPVNKI